MKLHELREEPEDIEVEEVEEDEAAELEEDLNEALKLIEEMLPILNSYTNGRLVGRRRRTKMQQEVLESLLADVSIFIDKWTVPAKVDRDFEL